MFSNVEGVEPSSLPREILPSTATSVRPNQVLAFTRFHQSYSLFLSDAVTYEAPEASKPKRAKIDTVLNVKKRSEEPSPTLGNYVEKPETKTDLPKQTESVEMVKARQRAEIEKVFEIARAFHIALAGTLIFRHTK